MSEPLTARSFAPPSDLGRLRSKAWLVGGIAAAASVLGAWADTPRFLEAYLVSWLLITGVALGCFAVLCLQHMTRGAWGFMILRVLEAAAETLPFLGILFLPVLLNLDVLYVWARPEVVAADEILQQKAPYLNPTFFIARTVLYFLIWTALTFILVRLSARQDLVEDRKLPRRIRLLAAPALGIYCLTVTFAAVDWIMSLEPHWYSSLFGVYFIGGHAVSAFAFIVPVALYLSAREPMSRALKPRHFHDYGKLLLAFVMLWAYFAVSQLLIIWSGNLAEEVGWYLERTRGPWKYVSIGLALLHFALPFLLLLSRDLKRDARRLVVVAALLLGMRWIDLYWQVAPVFAHEGLGLHWLDLATLLALGGLWFGLFLKRLESRPLLPLKDPDIDHFLEHDYD